MIDWHQLVSGFEPDALAGAAGVNVTPLAGGSINHCFRLDTGRARYFVKLNRADQESMFIAERFGLEVLRASQSLRVPAVVYQGCDQGYACLVLEFIELSAAPGPGVFAPALAALHGCRQQRFGFAIDNTIGSSPQLNGWLDDWIEFWRTRRLGYQLRLARDNGLPVDLINSGEQLRDVLGSFFGTYRPAASLLHGDLWGGNYAADENGLPVVYDPACYYGDHETDLAMMELFGNPGARFFDCYREHFPIDDGYPQRRNLYNLYHLLNHANLFGGSYVGQSKSMIAQLLAQI